MPTFCKCNNQLSETPKTFRVVQHPCKCDEPGPRSSWNHAPNLDPLDDVLPRQYEQRKRLNLPIQTDIERSSTIPWH